MRPRMTRATRLVLNEFLKCRTSELYSLQISKSVGLKNGTVQPILRRFEGLGWLESRFEEIDPVRCGRPRRRYYLLTAQGIESIAQCGCDLDESGQIRIYPYVNSI